MIKGEPEEVSNKTTNNYSNNIYEKPYKHNFGSVQLYIKNKRKFKKMKIDMSI